jgi:hypothetical protein
MMCPICLNYLKLIHGELDTVISGKEFPFLQKTRRKLINHQCKFHPNVHFWPCSEKEYRIMGT